ncbi:unnamed protein product [Diamesa hyperborea]
MKKNTIIYNTLTDPNIFNAKLINLVKDCPEIYDTKHKGYKELSGKANSWISISKNLDNAPIARVKKRWRSLRTEFVRNYRNSKPQRYDNLMNFILPFIGKNRKPQISVVDEQELDEVESEQDTEDNIDIRTSIDTEPPPKITKTSSNDSSIDLFFQAMAATLKTLPKHTQAQVKSEVFQIISKAEIASFSNS